MNDLAVSRGGVQQLDSPANLSEERIDFLEFWRAIAKRRWSILGLTLLVSILTLLVTNSMRPQYRGTATLLIEQGKSKVVSIEEVYSQGAIQREYYQTQLEILKSSDLAQKVVRKLNLTSHPDFDPRQRPRRWYAPLADLLNEREAEVNASGLEKTVVEQLKTDLTVTMIRNSQLAQLAFQSYDRALSAKVPNALAEIYIEADLDARMAMTQKASSWLRERMGELRTRVDASEKSLQDFRDRERIVDVKGTALSAASRQLDETSRSLVEARQKRAEAESAYTMVQQVKGRGAAAYESIPAVIRNPLVQRMKEQEADAERRLSEAAKRYGPEHPKMIQARAEVDGAKENTRKQVEVVVAGMGRDFEAARSNEMAIERALGQSKSDIQSFNRKEFQLGVLEREVQQNRNLYDMFVNRLKETSAASGTETTVGRVVDAATTPSSPFAPNKTRAILIAMIVTLVVSALLALLLDRLSNTLNSTGDVESRLGIPALGVLQKIKGFGKKGFVSELAFFNDTQSTFAEAVRTVRTSVLMSALDDPHKLVVVTSSVPEEGKTTLSFNLACALGQVKKVLLVDGDLRRPKIGRLVGRDSKGVGLADLVAGQTQVSQCIFYDERAGIHILTAGTVPPNPLELLSSRRFQEVVAKLREAFDIVVVDSAPLQLVSDAQILSQFASAVIYVVKADATPYQVAQNGLKKLRRVNAPILGVVLNQLDLEKAEKYYGEYSGYRSYAGYKYKKSGYAKTYGA